MSAITEAVAREVLDILVTHLPGELDELLGLAREARDAQEDMSRAQSAGPDGVPESVERAAETLRAALCALALDVEDYASATAVKAAMA